MKKIFYIIIITLIMVITPNVFAITERITSPAMLIQINEDGEMDTTTNGVDEHLNDYIDYEDGELSIKKTAYYVIQSNYYELEINQETSDIIYLNVWEDGDLTLNNLNSFTVQHDNITANGDMDINNSKMYLEAYHNNDVSLNAEYDITVNNSQIALAYDTSNDDNNNYDPNYSVFHSYYGDIIIKNNSKLDISGRLYTEDGDIKINDSTVNLDGLFGYMESGYDIDIINSKVKFLFGIKGENINIEKSNIEALNKESRYAVYGNDKNQGWIQSTDGSMIINNSDVDVINSITSGTNMEITKSNIKLRGTFSNNGYLQSSDGNITIKDSDIQADKDIYAGNDILIDNSNIKVLGTNSKQGYLEANGGKLTISKSNVIVDEGIVSEKDAIINTSSIKSNGINSKRGYFEVYNGNLNVDNSELNTNERIMCKQKTTFNKSKIYLRSGILSTGIDIIDSDFYASNKDTSKEFSKYSPIISLDKITISSSKFISESINDKPSIASLGEIILTKDNFVNKNYTVLDIIKVTASEDNFVKDGNAEFIEKGNIVYTTSLNGKISNYSSLGIEKKDIIVNPETAYSILIVIVIALLSVMGTIIYKRYNKELKINK